MVDNHEERGKLEVVLTTAKLTHDTEFFGQMDPYVVLKYGDDVKHKSSVHKSGGDEPDWKGEAFKFDINKPLDVPIKITVMDSDYLWDNHVGDCELDMNKYASQHQFKDWIDLVYKGKSAGRIMIHTIWREHGWEKEESSSSDEIDINEGIVVKGHKLERSNTRDDYV